MVPVGKGKGQTRSSFLRVNHMMFLCWHNVSLCTAELLGQKPRKLDGRTWDPTRSQPREVLEYTSHPSETELTRHCPEAAGLGGSPCLEQMVLGVSAAATTFVLQTLPCSPILLPLTTTLIPAPVWAIPPSRLRDMVYRLLEERSKKGAGRSMRALAWRVCAWVLPLYRNLEPITRKPLGGGSGDTSLEQRVVEMTDRDQACITRPRVRPQQAFHSRVPPPTILHSPERGDLGKGGLAVLIALSAPLNPHSLSHPSQSTQGRLTGRTCGAQCRPSRAAWLSGGWGA